VRFAFDLAGDADDVRLELFDVRGRAVRALVAGPRAAGRHTVAWDGRDAGGARLPAGLYFARLRAAGDEAVQRVVLTP
jgi:flagellar hook assembly protein FlgD